MSEQDEGRKGALDRGLSILNHLADAREASTAELAAAAEISRSAAYRIVEKLSTYDFLHATSDGRWRLGPAAARLAMAAVHSADVADVAPELLRVLVQQTRETVSLGVLSGDEMVFIYRERGPQSVSVNAELGARRPLHATSVGKAYLCGLDPRERADLLRTLTLTPYTPQTLTTTAALEADLTKAHSRGWTEEHGEFDLASACCGAPIFDHTGRVVAAISVAGLKDRVEPAMNRLGPLAVATADAISRRLGHNPAPTNVHLRPT
ncbi:IclR family transcriptional regulator [Streptomyces sp. enrichment culture]|uniref:IclR family transcriptional regulator n=1 Tax=Streptomyces sp. enrichment culture TaxID=1795815 RepID=UPI003F560529